MDAYQQSASYPSYEAGYPPPSPSSPYHQQSGGGQRRWSGDPGRPHSPSSRRGHGVGAAGRDVPHYQPSRSPLSQADAAQAYHAASASDDYEERGLGEIAAANQAAQERNWGPHTALSEAAERTVGLAPGQYHNQASMPMIPQYQSEQHHYDGGYYLEPRATYAAHREFGGERPGGGGEAHFSPSLASNGRTLGAGSRRSLPAYRSPSVQPSVTSPASDPPNIFNVTARHHLPGGHARPEDMYANHPYPGMQGQGMNGENLPNFPTWSQTWYGGHLSADGHAYTMVPPGSGQSGWESETLLHGRPGRGSPYGPYPYGQVARDPRMADHVKEERIRMLEREFGPKVSHKGKGKGAGDDDDEDDDEADDEPLPIGSVDPKGKLVLPGPKLRTTVRTLQVLVSIAGAGCGLGGNFLIKPTETPPPRGKLPSWVLYIVSAVSTLVCLWIYILRPMCSNPLRKMDGMSGGAGGMGQGLVIPVLGGGGGTGGKGKKLKRGMAAPGPTVNLIVDPSLLGGKGRRSDSDSESDASHSDTGDYLPGEERRRKRKRRRGHQRGPLGMIGNMKIQAAWQILRKWIKVATFVDVLFLLLWGTAAVWTAGFGESCLPGTFGGWCDVYNGAIACAAIAAAVFATAVYVDVRDLKASSRSPKAKI